MLKMGTITVIEAGGPEAFRREHIPGAVNLPHREIFCQATEELTCVHLVVNCCDGS